MVIGFRITLFRVPGVPESFDFNVFSTEAKWSNFVKITVAYFCSKQFYPINEVKSLCYIDERILGQICIFKMTL